MDKFVDYLPQLPPQVLKFPPTQDQGFHCKFVITVGASFPQKRGGVKLVLWT